MAELKRTLKLAEVTFFAAGVILGAGIYAIVGEAAGLGGNMLWLSFLLAAFTAVLTAFGYAELVSMFPTAGGEFTFVRESLDNKASYVVGSVVAFSGIGGGATIAIAFAGYFSQLLDVNTALIAVAIIAVILLVNTLGIRESSTFNIIFTLIETAGLIFVIVAASNNFEPVNYFELPEKGIHGLILGGALSFFAFTGFEDAIKLAEETKNPEKNIPRGLFLATGIVVVLYIIVVIMAVSAVPYQELAESDKPLALIVEGVFGKTGALVIAIVALFSTSNSLLSNMLGASRVSYAMAREGKIKYLDTVWQKRKTPVVALLLVALLMGCLAAIGDLKVVAYIGNFFVFSTFLMVNIAVIYLRIKEPAKKRPFHIPFSIGKWPIISLLAIVLTVIMMGYTIYGISLGYE